MAGRASVAPAAMAQAARTLLRLCLPRSCIHSTGSIFICSRPICSQIQSLSRYVPLALKGVSYRPVGAAQLLRNNLLIYGLGGLIVPFIGIKVIDLLLFAVDLS